MVQRESLSQQQKARLLLLHELTCTDGVSAAERQRLFDLAGLAPVMQQCITSLINLFITTQASSRASTADYAPVVTEESAAAELEHPSEEVATGEGPEVHVPQLRFQSRIERVVRKFIRDPAILPELGFVPVRGEGEEERESESDASRARQVLLEASEAARAARSRVEAAAGSRGGAGPGTSSSSSSKGPSSGSGTGQGVGLQLGSQFGGVGTFDLGLPGGSGFGAIEQEDDDDDDLGGGQAGGGAARGHEAGGSGDGSRSGKAKGGVVWSDKWLREYARQEDPPIRCTGGRIIVFVLGGVSPHELQALRRAGRELGREIVVGSTSLQTPRSFLEELILTDTHSPFYKDVEGRRRDRFKQAQSEAERVLKQQQEAFAGAKPSK